MFLVCMLTRLVFDHGWPKKKKKTLLVLDLLWGVAVDVVFVVVVLAVAK